ncbi:MAG: serine hydrolase domain-containing protein [Actinomycetota bacterium]|nr:serine hydrolase domain-containing protein [Actinomycetota bacterium]
MSTMSTEIVGPDAAGIDPARLDVLLRRVRLEVEHGPLSSVQVAVARHGKLAAFETVGGSRPDLRYILQSVGRGVVAGIVWKLIGEGVLDTAERVADIIPEFGTNGKEAVTVHQVLTHTAGFPFAPLGYPKMADRSQRLEAFGRWKLSYEPGAQFQYHLTSAAWIIGELVERRTGLDFSEYLRQEIAEPLGLTLETKVPVERQQSTIAWPVAIDRTSDDQEVDPWGPWFLANADILSAGEPSHSMVGTAADMALFYQALFTSGLWSPEAVAEGSRVHNSAAAAGDKLYGGSDIVTHMALFCTVTGDSPGDWMPRTASPATFGSGGAPCQMGFIDPVSGVSFAFLTNGYPLSGYDYSPAGRNRLITIGDLAGDLVR